MPRQPIVTLAHFLTSGDDMRPLLTPAGHSHAVARERHGLIIGRVRMLALLLAALTVAWVGVDAMSFRWPAWGALAADRLVSAGCFLTLACHPRWRRGRLGIAPALGLLVGVSLAFYLTAQLMLGLMGASAPGFLGEGAANTAYNDLPYIAAAGLALFPLTALETGLAGLAILGASALSMTLWPEILEGESLANALWHVLVTTGIAGIAGICQLRLLITLTDQASRDGLTQALTRQAGAELLAVRFANAERLTQPLTLAFFDLDQFKDVNDRYGHEAGDTVLREAARRIRASVRDSDTLVRWGGEEFLLILPATTLADALPIIDRLADGGLGLRPSGSPQTASIGLAERISDGSRDWNDLVAMSDVRMYAAKRAGRNRYTAVAGCLIPFIRPGLAGAA
ncbi:diguanylate cyclase (GGDEF)-like protein [Nitrospirillum amazonense]|uniref:diguanylate cyclase n=1 Tax=Nitrospirillum amazonense TaxID=28077 RepID=A0A560JI16_9PROT|nr:GGDEF domain-containing protein [Nitrospirillum amazonense]TWB70843.1 diguanylate cyclase (GGDEF)-like protein [Nitrospirillum amazonense]